MLSESNCKLGLSYYMVNLLLVFRCSGDLVYFGSVPETAFLSNTIHSMCVNYVPVLYAS